MKRVFGRILLCVSALAAVVGCGESLKPADSGVGSATVLAYMPQDQGEYSLQKFELIGISDIRKVAGRFVNFFISPKISKQDGKEKMVGMSPRAQFIRNSAGEYVASDNLTIEMFSIYAHMQKLAALDEELGAAGVNKWPRDIGVAVRDDAGMVNNAQYYGPADAMYFVRYTKSELPIQVNAGVLAHEHFHSLFYKLVPGPKAALESAHDRVADSSENLPRPTMLDGRSLDSGVRFKVVVAPAERERDMETDREMREVYYGALNEGFADFWGWMYTGDPDFIALSLPDQKEVRTLNNSGRGEDALVALDNVYGQLNNVKENLKSHEELTEEQIKNYYAQYRLGYKYAIGSRYSRLLKQLAGLAKTERKMTEMESRKFIAKSLLKILPLIKLADIGPESVVKTLAEAIPDLKESECDYLRSSVQKTEYAAIWSCEKTGDLWLLKKAP